MEMRKFVVELHTDGRMTWAEYTEPSSKEDQDRLCEGAFNAVSEYLNTYPAITWPPAVKGSYLKGASHMMELLRRAL